jgi:hypothetical protein
VEALGRQTLHDRWLRGGGRLPRQAGCFSRGVFDTGQKRPTRPSRAISPCLIPVP